MAPTYTSPPNRILFNELVWQLVRQIPAGKVASYGQIAGLVSPPDGMDPKSYQAFGARWVGGAMASCPESVPWQRVVNAQGMISQRPGASAQRELLEAEGVEFDERGRIDLKRFGWAGPQAE
jgi:methylated-DNA-protein-cysteine methyltransferase related protein